MNLFIAECEYSAGTAHDRECGGSSHSGPSRWRTTETAVAYQRVGGSVTPCYKRKGKNYVIKIKG